MQKNIFINLHYCDNNGNKSIMLETENDLKIQMTINSPPGVDSGVLCVTVHYSPSGADSGILCVTVLQSVRFWQKLTQISKNG